MFRSCSRFFRGSVTALALATTLLITSCGTGGPSSSTGPTSSGQAQTANGSASLQAEQSSEPSNEDDHQSALQEAEDYLLEQAVADPASLTGLSTAASVPDILPLEDPQSPQLPVTVTDFQGIEVTVDSADRILALDMYGTLAQTVVALGLGDQLVGRVTSSTESSLAELPLVTENGHDLNAEAILALAPTVVLMDTTNGPLEITEQLRSAGVTVVHFDPARTMDGIGSQIQAVAAALGVPESGSRLAQRVEEEVSSAIDTIAQVAQSGESQISMAFLYVRGTAGVFFILGDGSGADDLITALGGSDPASESGANGTIPASSEALVRLNPELILTMTGGIESTGGIEGFFARPGVAETAAGQKQRVVDMADGQVLSFGPNTAAVLLSLATAIYTDQNA